MRGQVPNDTSPATGEPAPWQDARLSPAERAAALVPLMTLEEKVAQLVGVWVGADASGEASRRTNPT